MPDRSDRYQLPSWPATNFNVDLWNSVFGDIADRLAAREELEASFQSLIDQGIQASLDYIQVTIAPQIAGLQTSIQLAQGQIEQIIVDGVSPNSLKLGGQLPAYYATAQALADGLEGKVSTTLTINGKPLSAPVNLDKADLDLDQVNNTSDESKPISEAQAAALATKLDKSGGNIGNAAAKAAFREAIGVDAWSIQPIGVPIPLSDDLAGVSAPPTDKGYRYIKLTASDAYNAGVLTSEDISGVAPLVAATAVVSLADSPLNGRTVSLINTEGRILRPSTSAGTKQNDALQNVTGSFDIRRGDGASEPIYNATGAFRTNLAGSSSVVVLGLGSGSLVSRQVSFDLSASGARTDAETRMKNLGVTYYMRIK